MRDENPGMTFPIKKRINTGLLIDMRAALNPILMKFSTHIPPVQGRFWCRFDPFPLPPGP